MMTTFGRTRIIFLFACTFGITCGGGPPFVCETEEQLTNVLQECAHKSMEPTLSDCLLASPAQDLSKVCHCANLSAEGIQPPSWHGCLSACSNLLSSMCGVRSLFNVGKDTDAGSLVLTLELCCPHGTVHGVIRPDMGGLCLIVPTIPEENNVTDEVAKDANRVACETGSVHDPVTDACAPLPLPSIFEALRTWNVDEVGRLVRQSNGVSQDDEHYLDPFDMIPNYWLTNGETALMMAVRLGAPTLVAELLQHPGIRRTVNVVNIARTYKTRVGTTYVPSPLHYAVAGLYEEATGVGLTYFRTPPYGEPIESEIAVTGVPIVQVTPPDDQGAPNYGKVLRLLLEASASPFAGSPSTSALHMAFEVGLMNAAKSLLESAHCPTLAYVSAAFMEPHAEFVNLVHAASGAMVPTMMASCREMLTSVSTNVDIGSYKAYGVNLQNSPSIQQGICTRAEVYDAYFARFADQVELLVKVGFERCGLDVKLRVNGVSTAARKALPYPAMFTKVLMCDHKTATKLLEYGADPFMDLPPFGPLIHSAAHRGCHQIVSAFLIAAQRNSTAEMVRLSAIEDAFQRVASDVSLDPLSKCYLRLAQKGVNPTDSDCKMAVAMEAVLDRFSLDSTGTFAIGAAAEAAIVNASTSSLSTAVKLAPGKMGWREYSGKAPLMHGMRNDGMACDIVEIDGLVNATEFYKRFRLINQPAMFRGGVLDWPARQKWTPKYLTNAIGQLKVQVSSLPYQSELNAGKAGGIELSVETFLKNMLSSGKTNLTGPAPVYLFDQYLLKSGKTGKQLADDFTTPAPFAGSEMTSVNLLVGPEGSGSPAHFHTGAFAAMLFGRKRWLLYPPSAAFWSKKTALSWLMDGDAHSVPTGQPLECVQQPGDFIYVPATWGHAVLNVEDTVAVTMTMDDLFLQKRSD
jgi:ankyrin repeat protein